MDYRINYTYAGSAAAYGNYEGPIDVRTPVNDVGSTPVRTIEIRYTDRFGNRTDWTALGSAAAEIYFFTGVSRVDGQPDTGGDPEGEPKIAPGVAPGAIPAHVPSGGALPNGKPIATPGDSPSPSGLPGLSPAPQPQLQPNPASSPGAPPFAEPPGFPSLLPPVLPGLTGSGGRTSPKGSPSSPSNSSKVQNPPTKLTDPEGQNKDRPKPPPQGSSCKSGCSAGLENKIDNVQQSVNNIAGGVIINNNGPEPDPSKCTLDEVCEKLDELAEKLGIEAFPLSHPLLTGESAGGQKDMVELIEWVTKNIDATNGYWPLEVKTVGADGNDRTIEIKDQAHAFHELFGAVFTIAEDADAAVNILVRNSIETVSARIRAIQNGKLLKAIQKHLGFDTRNEQGKVKIGFTTAATGPNGKLENQEMNAFLRKSSVDFVYQEHSDSKTQEIILSRMLENTEIARAALFKPIKRNKKGESTGPGESLRRENKGNTVDQILNEEWAAMLDRLRKQGVEVDEKPRVDTP